MITGKQRSMTGQFASCASFFTNSYLGITYFSRDYKRNDVRGVVDAYAASKIKSSVIRKRANLKTGVSRKPSSPNFPKNEHSLPPDTHPKMCVSGVRNVRFSENLACSVFLKHPF